MVNENYIFGGTDNRVPKYCHAPKNKVEPSLFGAFRHFYYDSVDPFELFPAPSRVECDFFPTAFSLLNGNFRGERTGHLRALVASDDIIKIALMSLKLVVR